MPSPSPLQSNSLTAIQLGRYGINVPAEWPSSASALSSIGHNLHLQPQPLVALDFQVVDGVATRENVAELVAMYCGAAKTWKQITPPDFPTPPDASLALTMDQQPNTLRREVFLFQSQGDLLAASLAYAKEPDNLPQLRRFLALMVAAALKSVAHGKGKV